MLRIKRSGGPRTADGKATTSRNAIKTGAYSATVVLPGESEEEFEKLAEQFVRDFAPREAAEGAMVQDLAVLTWKRSRLQRLEHAAVLRRLDKPITIEELAAEGVCLPEGCAEFVADLSLLTPEFWGEHYAIQKSIVRLQSIVLTDTVINNLPEQHPVLFGAICELALSKWSLDEAELTPTALAKRRVAVELFAKEPFLEFALRELFQQAALVLQVQLCRSEIEHAIPDIKEQRLLELMQLPAPNRASDDLSRRFYQTLAELRRHRGWRQENKIIDIDPEVEAA